MAIRYSRSVPADADADLFAEVEAEVREHLSAVADSDDDPTTHADDVRLWREPDGDNTKIVGELDAEPTAYYLAEDYNPDQDSDDTYAFEPWRPEGVDE